MTVHITTDSYINIWCTNVRIYPPFQPFPEHTKPMPCHGLGGAMTLCARQQLKNVFTHAHVSCLPAQLWKQNTSTDATSRFNYLQSNKQASQHGGTIAPPWRMSKWATNTCLYFQVVDSCKQQWQLGKGSQPRTGTSIKPSSDWQ